MPTFRVAAARAASIALLATGVPEALASHGGGEGTTTPPPTGAPAVSLGPSTVTYGAQDVGTTSPPQTITLTNTGTASLFINGISQRGLDPRR